MNNKKIVVTLLIVNVLQFIFGLVIWILIGSTFSKFNVYIYIAIGFMLLSNLLTIFGLYFASRYNNDYLRESLKDLEDLNSKLRSQRHDYLNHFQVIYGLMELEEFNEAKKYIEPVYKDIMKVSKALKTAQPAVNALLQAKIEAAEKKHIDMYLEIKSNLKNITLEPWNLCKVLANIIDNSFTAFERVDSEKILRFDISEDKYNYIFTISNNGPAIPKQNLELIFKQGFTTKHEDGHGMGLYIAKKILHEAKGSIVVTSTTEKTCFTISIPKHIE